MKLEHRDQPAVKRGDTPGVERQLLAAAVADPQHDCMAAKVESQGEGAAAARSGWQDSEAAGVGLKRYVPAVVQPRGVGDAELAEHLSREVQDR